MKKDRQAELALSYVRIARRRVREYVAGGSFVTPHQLVRLEHMMWNAEMLMGPWQYEDHAIDPPLGKDAADGF